MEDLKPNFNKNKFPNIQFPKNLKVQNKINTFLQLEHLEHLPNVYKVNPYEKLRIDENNDMYSVTFYDWKVNKTPKNILSLVINGESMGAYSEEYITYNNFDLRNGNKIFANSLFTNEGKTKITDFLNQCVNHEINIFLKGIKEIVPGENETKEDEEFKEMITEQISMFKECLNYSNTYTLENYDFTFQKDSIIFYRGRCSNHAMRALDDLDTFKISISYKELEKYLSPYGKSLCFDNSKIIETSMIEGKMYKGKINDKYPITAIIQNINSDNSTSIIYWYDRYNLPITCYGKFIHNQLFLNEENETGENIVIEANYVKNKIIGNWENKTNNKTFKLELIEY